MKNSPHITSARPTVPATASVCIGWIVNNNPDISVIKVLLDTKATSHVYNTVATVFSKTLNRWYPPKTKDRVKGRQLQQGPNLSAP